MEEHILKFLGQKRYSPTTSSGLIHQFGLAGDHKTHFLNHLENLERRGLVIRIPGGKYLSRQSPALVSGRIQITKGGRGFLTPDDPTLPEISIPAEGTGAALHDDHVLVLREKADRKKWLSGGMTLTGSVIQVLERKRTRFVGTLCRPGGKLRVTTDDPRFNRDIYISSSSAPRRKASVGDKVLVELTRWNSGHEQPEGKIIEVLGAPDGDGVDMLSVLRHYGLTPEFPDAVLKEAQSFGNKVTRADLKGRNDCRAHQVVTIDPDDSKDFDDAICLEQTGPDRWKLWVHIADVSHYVCPGSALDEEALCRGNSTYLVDRVIPMLPEELSNELCSLKPNVDRLTKCVEFLLTGDGKVLNTQFYPAVIHSRKRLTYAQAMAVLQRRPGDQIEEMLHHANHLAQALRKRRYQNGSLDFDFPEARIRLDARGKVERIDQQENDLSHQLIEEFMLLANEAAAGRLMKLKRPSIYRVHEAPDPARLRDYREDVLSHSIPCGNLTRPAEVQKLFRRLGSQAIGKALKIGFLKALSRARYRVDSLGHYGLAKKKYTHFTSPIRRYADLVVHRSLFAPQPQASSLPLRKVADHLSCSERNSADAERDSRDLKLYAHLSDQIQSGKPVRYSAQVTSLRHFGFFVDVAGLGMSGVVPLSLLEDDHYTHDTVRHEIRGRRGYRVIQLGDVVELEVARVDSDRKMVDFRLAGFAPAPSRKRTRSSGKRRNESSVSKERPAPANRNPVSRRKPRRERRPEVVIQQPMSASS